MSTDYISLTLDNIDDEHLCCALGDPKHAEGVLRKKTWLKKRLKEGLVFRKLNVRGKVFIEYAPSEFAWRPIVATNWLTIHCMWVSGRFAKQGHAKRLVLDCIEDARRQNKDGVVVAAAKRKRPFLSDPKFFAHLGFEVVDTAGDYLLLGYRIAPNAKTPQFPSSVKSPRSSSDGVYRIQHTDQCPFNVYTTQQMANTMEAQGYDVAVERVTTRKKAQSVPSPLGCFGLKRNGELVTHHLQGENALKKLLSPAR